MTAPASTKPATEATVNGLQEVDRLGRQIGFIANPSFQSKQGFDYSPLNPETTELLQRTANRIRERGTATIIATGAELMEIKARLKAELAHGHFGNWLKAEFGWTERTAQNYMQAAAVFASKSETVSDLPPAVIYKLASKTTPPAVREAVIGRLAGGDRPTKAEIIDLVAAARQEAKIEKLPPNQRVAVRRKAADKRQSFERARRQQDLRLAEEAEAKQRVVALLLHELDRDRLLELTADFQKIVFWSDLGNEVREQLSDDPTVERTGLDGKTCKMPAKKPESEHEVDDDEDFVTDDFANLSKRTRKLEARNKVITAALNAKEGQASRDWPADMKPRQVKYRDKCLAAIAWWQRELEQLYGEVTGRPSWRVEITTKDGRRLGTGARFGTRGEAEFYNTNFAPSDRGGLGSDYASGEVIPCENEKANVSIEGDTIRFRHGDCALLEWHETADQGRGVEQSL
jgi:hypothetical protein